MREGSQLNIFAKDDGIIRQGTIGMLEKVILHNYRCFENSEIDFRDTTVVVGNNNAGKSTLVEALRIIGEAAQKFKHTNYIPAPAELNLPAITKGFKINLEHLRIDLRTIVYRYRANTFAELKASFSKNVSIKVFLANGFAFAIIDSNGENISKRSAAQALNDLDLFVMPQIGLIREDEAHLSDDTIKRDMSTRLSSRHFRNELYYYRKEHFDTFRSLAQETWPTLRIEEPSWEMGGNISLLVTDEDYAAEIGMMGSGLQMWLQIMWFISRCPQTATVILDEPDAYMHPDLQRKIVRIVQKRFNQVVVATHSVEIISAVEPRQIVKVDKKSRKMQYANNYKAVQEIISNLGSEHNLSLTRLGDVKKCVFVEGKDIQTLKKIQGILYPNSQIMVDQLPTVSLGGWSRFKEALGAARLFYEETHGEIKTYCILDRDYHTKSEIEELYSLSSQNHLELHIWSRKELENYLLVPAALAKVAGISIDDECAFDAFCNELFHELDKLASQTKGGILDQLCLQDRSKNPSYYMQEADQRFSDCWKTLDGRLAFANGKDIISLVNTWIHSRYKKSSSRSKIISALSEKDISEEMKQVIDTLLE